MKGNKHTSSAIYGKEEGMVENLLGIPCGHNPVVLGSVVDGNTKIFGEIVTVFSGDIIFGNLKKMDVYTEGEILKLSDLYDKYNNTSEQNPLKKIVYTIRQNWGKDLTPIELETVTKMLGDYPFEIIDFVPCRLW